MSPVRFVLVCLLAAASPARADELVFQNGDRISGKVISLVDGKLAFESPILGELEIDASELQNVSTTEPVEIHTSDGTVFTDVAVKGAPGELRTAGASQVGVQQLALADMVAINPPPPPTPAWHGRVTAGMNIERGNSFTQEADVDVNASRETEKDRITFDFEYDADRNKNVDTGISTTTERTLFGELKYDWFISERWYWYGNSSGKKDGVAGLDLRFTAGGGLGYRWFKTEKRTLETELGLNWVSENYQDTSNDNDYLGLQLRWLAERELSDRLTLFTNGKWLLDTSEWDDRFVVESVAGLRNALTSKLFLEARIEWDYDAEPSTGKKREDVEYIFALGYRF